MMDDELIKLYEQRVELWRKMAYRLTFVVAILCAAFIALVVTLCS